MSRLIDADKLIEDVLNSMPTGSARGVFRAFIEEQPTAFDVDKVVSELEDYKMWKELLIYDLDFRERQIIKRALEIVWKGGIDENRNI